MRKETELALKWLKRSEKSLKLAIEIKELLISKIFDFQLF
jgi:hypothetical protein